MKLKEKLGKEYAVLSGDSTDASAFLVGFDKGKEMAKDKINKRVEGLIHVEHGLTNEFPKHVQESLFTIGDCLDSLGEEEVQ